MPRLMDHLQIARAHVVGYSLGGTLALKLIEIAPQRRLSLVLGGAGWERDGQQWIGLAGLLESVKPNTPLSLYFWPNESGRPPREVVQMVDRNDPAALAALSRGMLHVSVTEDALRSARVPILAVSAKTIRSKQAAQQCRELRRTFRCGLSRAWITTPLRDRRSFGARFAGFSQTTNRRLVEECWVRLDRGATGIRSRTEMGLTIGREQARRAI